MHSSIATTRLVNPPDAEVQLTAEQLWKALELKVRKPEVFLPVFASSEIVSKDGNKVVRKATTKTGQISEETCYSYEPTIVSFEGNGASTMRVTNVISYNESGELLLTYSFSNGIPIVPVEEQVDPVLVAQKLGAAAVEHTLQVARALAKDGKL